MSRIITGVVSSDKNDKSIVITVATRKTHPIYRKQYTRNRKFMAHDEKNEAKVGDIVQIKESKPMSARKRFSLEKIVERAQAGFEETDAEADIPKEDLQKQKPEPKVKAGAAEDIKEKPAKPEKDKS